MTPALFEAQIAALAQAGYTAVFPDDLAAYVNQGKALPRTSPSSSPLTTAT